MLPACFLFLISCRKEENQSPSKAEVKFYVSNPEPSESVSGISNSIIVHGKMFVLRGASPEAHFPGYADAGTPFYKLAMIGDGIDPVWLETTPSARDMIHSCLTRTPSGNIGVVYAKPSGHGYGFDLYYREYTSNGAMLKTEKVFANANWGAWPRLEFSDNGTAHIATFAHDAYSLRYFRRLPGSGWESFQLTPDNTIIVDLQSVMKGQDFCVSGRLGQGSTGRLCFYKIAGSSAVQYIIDSNVNTNCDLHVDNQGNTRFLYTAGDQLKLANMNGWQYETVIYEDGISARAKMITDADGQLIIAYQTTSKVVVLKKIFGQWTSIWQTNYAPVSEQSFGQGPSLITAGGSLFVVYTNGSGVFKSEI